MVTALPVSSPTFLQRTNDIPPKVRLYTKSPGTAYLLPSDEEERIRLTRQHALITKAFGGLLHAPVKLSAEDIVLENASGTGIWLLELALSNELSNECQMIGIDIEPRLFPKPDTLPRNINFEVQSVLRMPSEWDNKYRLVHQRLLRAALRTTEWVQALKEIYRVLMPGGWLQLVEGNGWVAGPVMNTFRSILVKLAEARGIEIQSDAVPVLKKYLEDCGFVDLRITCRSTPIGESAGKDGIDARDIMLSLYRGIKAPVLAAGGFGIVQDENMYDALLDQVKQEMNSTPNAECRWITICAQKPISRSF